ncbi:hypothetical protein BP5796_09790 [Coleophoma crateriformis]|uniref:Zn(2)-C6 fungal-type domain-containing protein n=1 Tax=Coleophoma crateriformis TaxID=565419 RepID=A0A3D8QZF2_9HELO|nr:hypothetical protein BP5796_09790 [Coleophoma crateriformis]
MDKTASTTPIRKKKKTLNACQRCRNRKIKCSGQHPCQHCMAKSLTCVFEDRPKKLVVSEDYLYELQSRASAAEKGNRGAASPALTSSLPAQSLQGSVERRLESSSGSPPHLSHPVEPRHRSSHIHEDSLPRGQNHIRHDRYTNLEHAVDHPSSVESPAIGDEFRRLGHSSSWSFSRRIRNMINDAMHGPALHDAIPIRDGAYGIPWKQPLIDLTGLDLPSQEYAEYLTHTVSYTMGPLYYLFDKTVFLRKLHEFYSARKSGRERSTDLWLIQMLIVLAFGKSILAREAGPSGPTGATYFARAMEALPDSHRLYQDPILGIEILCMLALMLQALDMRFAAHDSIGRAARMGLTHGFNRVYDAKRITYEEFEHRSRLWWTVYIIDRRLSSLVGVPSSVLDEDIAVSRPTLSGPDGKDLTFALHVETSSQLGQILNVVYGLGLERQLGSKFISAIQSILHRLGETSTLLDKSVKIQFQNPMNIISREAASLHLLHHQCSILAIRPVLFYLFEAKVRSGNTTLTLSDAVIGLLRVCVESALQVLKIIDTLHSHKLVDLLLPFDLDAMFAAAFVLVLVDIITPAAAGQWELGRTLSLMDEMMMRGIVTAGPYKKDLVELWEMGQRHKSTYQQEQPARQELPTSVQTADSQPESAPQDVSMNPPLEQDLIWSWMATEDGGLASLHPDTIQSAIDGLNFDFLNDPTAIQMDSSEWMWGNGGLNWPDT